MGTQTRTVVMCGECGTDPETAQVDWKHLTGLFRARTEFPRRRALAYLP